MEQEILEQAAERLTELAYKNDNYEKGRLKRIGYYDGIIDGAKWQAKTMYSEEEVKRLAFTAMDYKTERIINLSEKLKWFEQFKKK